jgi:hypothetical protein
MGQGLHEAIVARQELTALGYVEDLGERRPDSRGVMQSVLASVDARTYRLRVSASRLHA